MNSTYLSEDTGSRLNVIYFNALEGMWVQCLEAG